MSATSRYLSLWCAPIFFVALLSHADAQTPDISGPWQIEAPLNALKTAAGAPPPLLPAAQKIWEENKAALAKDKTSDPIATCLPPGVPRLMMQPFAFNIVQGRNMYGMMFEWNHLTRVIYLIRDRFEMLGPAYLGQSIGHWDGDTLVVETNSYNDSTWLDDTGLPHSDELTTVERIRLVNGGRSLEDKITFKDPKTFSRDWNAVLVFKKKPGAIIGEDYCLARLGLVGRGAK